jgi:hypothetical protein
MACLRGYGNRGVARIRDLTRHRTGIMVYERLPGLPRFQGETNLASRAGIVQRCRKTGEQNGKEGLLQLLLRR